MNLGSWIISLIWSPIDYMTSESLLPLPIFVSLFYLQNRDNYYAFPLGKCSMTVSCRWFWKQVPFCVAGQSLNFIEEVHLIKLFIMHISPKWVIFLLTFLIQSKLCSCKKRIHFPETAFRGRFYLMFICKHWKYIWQQFGNVHMIHEI